MLKIVFRKVDGPTMKSVVRFISEVKLELSRVIWPKMDEWIGSTMIVLFLMAVFAIYFLFVDTLLNKLMGQIFKIYS